MLDWVNQWLASIPAPILFLGGVALLLAGGRWLVEGSVRIALAMNISTLLIGLTVVAFGTSSPELFFNVAAAAAGLGDLSFGNVVGSNIANITLVLGVAALITPIGVHSRVIKKELPLLLAVCVAMFLAAWIPITPPPETVYGYDTIDGIVLLVAFLGCSVVWYRVARRDRSDPLAVEAQEVAEEPRMKIGVAIALFIVGLIGLLGGAELTQRGAVGIAQALGLSEAVIGLTIVALATSLPEVVTSIVAARRGHGDLAVGNVVGSNLFNILLVLGTTATVGPVPIPTLFGWWDLVVMFGVTVVLLPIAITHQQRIMRGEGIFLLLCYVAYMVWTITREL